MPRKFLRPKTRCDVTITPALADYLVTGEMADDMSDEDRWLVFAATTPHRLGMLHETWATHREELGHQA